MFTKINTGRSFKILFNALILLILVIQPVPAQEVTLEIDLPEQFSGEKSFGNTLLESDGPGRLADSEDEIKNVGKDLHR